jgi:hypothetical protein
MTLGIKERGGGRATVGVAYWSKLRRNNSNVIKKKTDKFSARFGDDVIQLDVYHKTTKYLYAFHVKVSKNAFKKHLHLKIDKFCLPF